MLYFPINEDALVSVFPRKGQHGIGDIVSKIIRSIAMAKQSDLYNTCKVICKKQTNEK